MSNRWHGRQQQCEFSTEQRSVQVLKWIYVTLLLYIGVGMDDMKQIQRERQKKDNHNMSE